MGGVLTGTFANRMFAAERHRDVLERVSGGTPPMSPRIGWYLTQKIAVSKAGPSYSSTNSPKKPKPNKLTHGYQVQKSERTEGE